MNTKYGHTGELIPDITHANSAIRSASMLTGPEDFLFSSSCSFTRILASFPCFSIVFKTFYQGGVFFGLQLLHEAENDVGESFPAIGGPIEQGRDDLQEIL